jgi:hypothetical protein
MRGEPSPELSLVRAGLVIRWRIQRMSGAIDWKSFRDDLHGILTTQRFRDDAIKRFYFAVAQYHCGEISEATANFSGLKRLAGYAMAPNAIRCYYIGSEGNPKRFQGTIERHHLNSYILIPELNSTVPARGHSADAGPGGTAHAYIGFSITGPIAVFDRPGERDSLLP